MGFARTTELRAVAVFLTVAAGLFAQNQQATLRIAVTGKSSPVSDAAVSVNAQTVRTDASGIAVTTTTPGPVTVRVTKDGFFRSGDVGRIDEHGYVHLVGRAKDLIITGGFNVYPAEVESHIDRLQGVVESAVIGVPHPDFGEGVVAVIVAQAHAVPDEATILTTLKASIANFKVPKRVLVVDELPRNAMGKVQKNLLRQAHGHLFVAPDA